MTTCSPAPRPSSSRTRATAGPAARSRSGSRTTARAVSARPWECARTPASSAARRASARIAPPSSAATASVAGSARPASSARTVAGRTIAGPAAGSSRPTTSAASTRWRGCARSVARPRGRRGESSARTPGALLAAPGQRPPAGAAPAPAPGSLRCRVHRSDPDPLAKCREAFLADPWDLVELVDGGEPAVLLAVVEDLLGRGGADPVERVELLERRRVEVQRLVGRRRRRRRRAPPRARADRLGRTGTRIWRPSSSLAARLIWVRSALRVGPPARSSASSTRAPDASR